MSPKPVPPGSTEPMSQRRQGLLRGLVTVLQIGGGALSLPFLVGGFRAVVEDLDNGVTLMMLGGALLMAAVLGPPWVIRRWGRTLTTTPDLAVALPFGATQRGDGVVLRPRAAVRVVPGLLVPLLGLVLLGMGLDGVNPVALWVVGVLTVGVLLGWLLLRRYELCLDRAGVWHRRRPGRWRLAWQDLERTETVPTPKSANGARPDDLVLHGLVARPGGGATPTVRIRMNLLAISVSDLQRLADHFAGQGRGTAESGFDCWS